MVEPLSRCFPARHPRRSTTCNSSRRRERPVERSLCLARKPRFYHGRQVNPQNPHTPPPLFFCYKHRHENTICSVCAAMCCKHRSFLGKMKLSELLRQTITVQITEKNHPILYHTCTSQLLNLFATASTKKNSPPKPLPTPQTLPEPPPLIQSPETSSRKLSCRWSTGGSNDRKSRRCSATLR